MCANMLTRAQAPPSEGFYDYNTSCFMSNIKTGVMINTYSKIKVNLRIPFFPKYEQTRDSNTCVCI